MSEFKCRQEGHAETLRVLDGLTLSIKGGGRSVQLKDADAVPLAQAILDTAGVDAVVLTDLPDVREDFENTGVLVCEGLDHGKHYGNGASTYLAQARRYAAVARHLEQHPPVDPQVEKLADVMRLVFKNTSLTGTFEMVAERMIAAGVRVEETDR